ncbi:MAG: hydrogenase [Fusobacteriia bacterium 4572_132]|nr:MAG: hydrogenase [Fusobacteriia bacterium 4572_132]
MAELVILIPIIAGILSLLLKNKYGRWLLPITGIIHIIFTILIWMKISVPLFNQYVGIKPEGILVLGVTSYLFFMISIYTVSYLKEENMKNEKLFVNSMLFFLASMSSVAISNSLILFWISVEATSLTSAPLIYIHKTKTSLEATWKYILVCSVGIALALLGTFLIAIARDKAGLIINLNFTELEKNALLLNEDWLKAGFLFILVGYGTKMGLAPMHTWLPDAHSEAPSPASALLSGALLNTAFLGIFKMSRILHLANLGEFVDTSLIILGLLSMVIAAVFILKQYDYKRMLAYSSVENMGIIAFGTGIGGIAAYGAMLHLVHHALIKSSLFLSAGNVLMSYKTKLIDKVGNIFKFLPKTAIIMFAGVIGIAGFPPFGLFFSEFFIILGALKKSAYLSAGVFILSLILIFAGFIKYIIKMTFGESEVEPKIKENRWRTYPQYILIFTSLVLCYVQIDQISNIITSAVAVFGGMIHE